MELLKEFAKYGGKRGQIYRHFLVKLSAYVLFIQ